MEIAWTIALVFAAAAAACAVLWKGERKGRFSAEEKLAEAEAKRIEAESALSSVRIDLALANEREKNATEAAAALRSGLDQLRAKYDELSAKSQDIGEKLSSQTTLSQGLEEKNVEWQKRMLEARGELEKARQELALQRDGREQAEKRLEGLEKSREEEKRGFEERMHELKELKEQMEGVFARLSGSALERNSEAFLKLAQENLGKLNEQNAAELEKRRAAVAELVKPVQEAMAKVGQSVDTFDKNRLESFTAMAEKLEALRRQEESLEKQTTALGEALRKPGVRGAWGEMQLRRVVEYAGLVERCHFAEQPAITAEDRPDMIVDLPNGLQIVVDAKAPMDAYMRAVNEEDPERLKADLAQHARQIRERARLLGQKKYTEKLACTPDFTVLFLPSEALFSVALDVDPELLDFGMQNRIVIATPTTLIALLLTISTGWKERNLASNAAELKSQCEELYKRLCRFLSLYSDVGKNLSRAIKSYNASVGSMQSQLLVQARRVNELGLFDDGEKRLEEGSPDYVEETEPRELRAKELEEAKE